jgi:hypothetical protein
MDEPTPPVALNVAIPAALTGSSFARTGPLLTVTDGDASSEEQFRYSNGVILSERQRQGGALVVKMGGATFGGTKTTCSSD